MRFDIVLAPFPFDDLSIVKPRPAVCLTHPVGYYRHVTIAYVTSQVLSSMELSDLMLHPNDPDFSVSGLRVASTIRLHRLISVPTDRILGQLGILPSCYHSELEQKLRVLFGL